MILSYAGDETAVRIDFFRGRARSPKMAFETCDAGRKGLGPAMKIGFLVGSRALDGHRQRDRGEQQAARASEAGNVTFM